mmetsp:Transcript_25565/g.65836  ORF Transcript_25565/g.65836 Transcript_25565/m.65836 type:complete len:244 (-) Transcript_25565:278-1009(-)
MQQTTALCWQPLLAAGMSRSFIPCMLSSGTSNNNKQTDTKNMCKALHLHKPTTWTISLFHHHMHFLKPPPYQTPHPSSHHLTILTAHTSNMMLKSTNGFPLSRPSTCWPACHSSAPPLPWLSLPRWTPPWLMTHCLKPTVRLAAAAAALQQVTCSHSRSRSSCTNSRSVSSSPRERRRTEVGQQEVQQTRTEAQRLQRRSRQRMQRVRGPCRSALSSSTLSRASCPVPCAVCLSCPWPLSQAY